jgi:predicted RNA-binding protein YlxR (DUF448 family)
MNRIKTIDILYYMNNKNNSSGVLRIVRANKGEAVIDLSLGRICVICGEYKDRSCFFRWSM